MTLLPSLAQADGIEHPAPCPSRGIDSTTLWEGGMYLPMGQELWIVSRRFDHLIRFAKSRRRMCSLEVFCVHPVQLGFHIPDTSKARSLTLKQDMLLNQMGANLFEASNASSVP